MKLHGQTFTEPNIEIIALPRSSGDVIFQAQAILSYDEFEKYCPAPKPPVKIKPDKSRIEDLEDKDFLNAVGERELKRNAWMVITSLKATEGLEWEKVKFDQPSTWRLWIDELQEAKFSIPEIARIQQGVFAANSLNENLVKAARENFLRGQAAAKAESSGQLT